MILVDCRQIVGMIVHSYKPEQPSQPYPLCNKPIRYENPFESVAEDTWEILSSKKYLSLCKQF